MSRLVSALAAPLAIAVVALVAGCTTVPPEQRAAACASTDWQRYGINDGKLGVPASERVDRFQDCAELGHPVDTAAYQAGRAEGLREYCTVENGYDVGYQGRRYDDVCPPELAPDFLQGLAQGREARPSYSLYPGLGIGIGSGGVRTGIGIGVGVGGFYDDDYYYRDRYLRDPFPSSWRRHRFGGGAFGCGPVRPLRLLVTGAGGPHRPPTRPAIPPPLPGGRRWRPASARHPAPPCSPCRPR